ncbi:glycosyltransferase family 39 protein, partial [bacterium]|nr:glycosyltransferase family 39 protein [bacterium]
MTHRPSRDTRLVIAIAGASLLVRLAVALCTDTFQDEALYWWQGREAGVTFTPQPPIVPLAVWAASGALGEGLGAVRLLSLLAGTATIFLAWLLGRDLFDHRTGVVAALLAACCPLLMGTGAVATPEAPVVATWLFMVWAFRRSVTSGQLRWWLIAGFAAALGLFTKYMMVLALPCGLAALAATPEGRKQLKTPGPWVAIGLCGLLFAPPFLLWNGARGWPTF